MITRRKGGWVHVEEGKGGIDGGGRRLDFRCWAHSTIQRWHIIELCTWNLYDFINQCCLNRFNKNLKKERKRPLFLLVFLPYFFLLKILFFIFRERGKEGEREGEKRCERETLISCLPHAPWPGTEPATQACVLTGSCTADPLLFGKMPNQLSHWSGLFHTFCFMYSRTLFLGAYKFRLV